VTVAAKTATKLNHELACAEEMLSRVLRLRAPLLSGDMFLLQNEWPHGRPSTAMLKWRNADIVTSSEHGECRGLHWKKVMIVAHDGASLWLQSAVDDVMTGKVRWGCYGEQSRVVLLGASKVTSRFPQIMMKYRTGTHLIVFALMTPKKKKITHCGLDALDSAQCLRYLLYGTGT
jgi:hypothetical protein